ncbi:uncharacterized protein DNG_02287 [Cephalotrichum gorgonifer]|uniref:FAD-binding PCMH-type domain-containing protein n=1 Tax=Cephalotrichum gorgonifer TaxID=2041049 RepID=A0AAE8MT73_9PEZI|nr:uncharacterized protein DNG_02287 [Cephalotrichum gorgonifer]
MSTDSVATESAAAASNLLRAAFPGRDLTHHDDMGFEAEVRKPWSQTCWIPSTAYVSLATSQEVADALAIIQKTGSKFAIRGGGHNPNAGFNSIENGVVLDLSRLKSKTLEEDGVAHIGAGNTWGEVVLADGSQVSANAETNSDLFWALKGGGTNFGVVTRFDIATYPLIKTQYTISLYDGSDMSPIINTSTEVHKAMEADSNIGFFVNFRSGIVVVGLLYADTPAEPPNVFDAFSKLPSLQANVVPTTNGTILSLAKAMARPEDTLRRAISTVTTEPSKELYEGINKIFQEVTRGLPDAVQIHYTAQPVGPSCVEAGIGQGGNPLGLKKVMQDWWVFTAEWAGEDNDAVASKALSELSKGTRRLARELGLLLEYVSSTFAGAPDDVLGSYGAENVKGLRTVAAKYDPDGVFQSLQNGGFLLRNLVV